MVFAAVLTYSRILALRYVMTISMTIQTSSWMDARVERESTKKEMYILGLVQHGENIAWNLNKPVTNRRVSCVGPALKGTESAGINRWKEEIKKGFKFYISNPCR